MTPRPRFLSVIEVIEQLLNDVRHAGRSLVNAPAYALTAVAVLAVGIGANTAVFSVADAVLFRPLPYPQPERLLSFGLRHPEGSSSCCDLATFRFLREHEQVTEAIAAVGMTSGVNVATLEAAFYAQTARVSAQYFDVLGVHPRIGRVFGEHELEQPLVVLGHDAHARLGGQDELIGSSVVLGGDAHIVIGVMPEGFVGVPRSELWIPAKPDFQGAGSNFLLLGRLRSGLTMASADAAVAGLSDEYFRLRNQEPGQRRLDVVSLRSKLTSNRRSELLLLLGAVSLLLLVACANCASLLLARLSARDRELSIRVALGGGRARILQLVTVEGLLLGLVGGVAGAVVAKVGLDLFATVAPSDILSWAPQLDVRVLSVCLLLSVLSG